MLLPVLRPLVSPDYILQSYCELGSSRLLSWRPPCSTVESMAMRPVAELEAEAARCPGRNAPNYLATVAGGPCCPACTTGSSPGGQPTAIQQAADNARTALTVRRLFENATNSALKGAAISGAIGGLVGHWLGHPVIGATALALIGYKIGWFFGQPAGGH